MLPKKTHDKYRKNRKNNKFDKILVLEKEEYCKNNKCNKIPDLESKGAKKGPEMSAIIAKIAKVTRIFLASLKHP